MTDRDWTHDAACADEDPELWFSDEFAARAQSICRACPVRSDCLAYALYEGIECGTWGGLTADERARLLAAGDVKGSSGE